MQTILLLIHLLLAIVLVIVVLLQRSEGGALGIGGGGAGGGGLMTGRGAANLLTRSTAVIAALFIATSIGLAILAGASSEGPRLIEEPAPVADEPAEPAEPAAPAVPVAE